MTMLKDNVQQNANTLGGALIDQREEKQYFQTSRFS